MLCAIVKAAGGRLDLTQEQAQKAVQIAFVPVFQPAERLIVDQPEDSLLDLLLAELSAEQCRSPSHHHGS